MSDDSKDIPLNGKCIFMDAATRTFRMKDVDGTEHPFKWTEPLDVVMMRNGEAKWKSGYYLTVTYNPDTHTVKNVAYWQEGKDKFPKESKGTGYKGQPKNDRAIIHEVTYQEIHATIRQWLVIQPDPVTFEELIGFMNKGKDLALEHGKALCDAAGIIQ